MFCKKLIKQKGFSFIELIVVVAIMGLVTSIVLFRQSRFSSDILITNMAYEIALAIRQVETLGISSKSTVSGSGLDLANYKLGYGLNFTPGNSGSVLNFYTEFIDLPVSNTVNPGVDTEFNYVFDNTNPVAGGGEWLRTVSLTQGQKIHEYCARDQSGTWTCGPQNNVVMNIVFVKPNPDAHITLGTKTGTALDYGLSDTNTYDEAKIVVESALGDKCRTVRVSVSGQIAVDPVHPESDVDGGCGNVN